MVGKYQAYPAYKESSSLWFDTLPTHWNRIMLKRVVSAIKDGTHGTYTRVDAGVPLLSAKNVFSNGIRVTDGESMISEEHYAEIIQNGFPARGDILVTCVGTIGRAFVYDRDEPIAFQRSVAFLRLVNEAFPQFYKYYIDSKPYQSQLQSLVKSSAQGGVYMGDLVATESVLPPLEEQRTIAAFLDHETARIDRLIEKQQRLIELLKEKRQAVISHAVTKGLVPNVPMKDSGVEWLGRVPEHWVVGPVKYVLHVKKGACKAGPFGSHLTNADMNGSDVKVVTQRNVIDNDMTSGEAFISAEKYEQLKAFTIERGDLLVTTRGTIGRTSLFETDAPAILHPCLIRLQVNERILNPNWLALIIQESGYVVEQILVNSNATTIEVIYSESLLNVDVAYPPTTGEQEEVLQVISQQRLRYDLLIQKAMQLIDALQERRTALISAAVTGKIDVRNWQPNASTQAAEPYLPMAAEQAAEYRV